MSDLHHLCLWCLEPVAPGEEDPRCPAGAIDLPQGPRFSIYHRECLTRATVGSIDHQLGRCSCFGGAGSHGDPPELLPQCNCDFGVSQRRGGYATPLLHALGFKRDWKKELQRRREVDRELRDPAARPSLGVRVEPVPQEEERGVTLACAPPHEWA